MSCTTIRYQMGAVGGWMDRWMERFIDPNTGENLYITEEN